MLTNEVNAASSSFIPVKHLKIDTVDGEKYSPQKHKVIAGIVIYRNSINGNKVLAFSTFNKYRAYHEKKLSTKSVKSMIYSSNTYFYEHASFDSRGLGNWAYLPVGYSTSYVGDNWNDKISSVNIYPWTWVSFYQHWNYEGYYFTFINNADGYWFNNLTDYWMPDGTSWNDQASSIATGWY